MRKESRYLRRKFDTWLESWKLDPTHKPLLVKGARQVGKTESIRHFANDHYDNVIEVNFVFQPEFKQITADGYKAERVIKRMSALDPMLRFIPRRTLLFLMRFRSSQMSRRRSRISRRMAAST